MFKESLHDEEFYWPNKILHHANSPWIKFISPPHFLTYFLIAFLAPDERRLLDILPACKLLIKINRKKLIGSNLHLKLSLEEVLEVSGALAARLKK